MTKKKNQTSTKLSPKDLKNNNSGKDTASHTERNHLNDIRFPLMALFLTAALFSYLLELPPWVTLVSGVTISGVWAIVREKALLGALMRAWSTQWILLAPIIATGVYALLDMVIQTVSISALQSGELQSNQELPTIFIWLLQLRQDGEQFSPIVLGIGGGLLLGVGEEIFWRGYLQTRLMLLTSHGISVLATAGLYTIFYFFSLGPLAAALSGFMGIILSMLTLRSRSLLPAMICHSSFLILALWLQPDIAGIL